MTLFRGSLDLSQPHELGVITRTCLSFMDVWTCLGLDGLFTQTHLDRESFLTRILYCGFYYYYLDVSPSCLTQTGLSLIEVLSRTGLVTISRVFCLWSFLLVCLGLAGLGPVKQNTKVTGPH